MSRDGCMCAAFLLRLPRHCFVASRGAAVYVHEGPSALRGGRVQFFWRFQRGWPLQQRKGGHGTINLLVQCHSWQTHVASKPALFFCGQHLQCWRFMISRSKLASKRIVAGHVGSLCWSRENIRISPGEQEFRSASWLRVSPGIRLQAILT